MNHLPLIFSTFKYSTALRTDINIAILTTTDRFNEHVAGKMNLPPFITIEIPDISFTACGIDIISEKPSTQLKPAASRNSICSRIVLISSCAGRWIPLFSFSQLFLSILRTTLRADPTTYNRPPIVRVLLMANSYGIGSSSPSNHYL